MNRIRFDMPPDENKKEYILKKIKQFEEDNNIIIPEYALVILTGDIVNLLINCAVCWFDGEKETNGVFERNKQRCLKQGIIIGKLKNIDDVCK